MKKIVLVLVVFLGFAGVIMGQDYTFQGLPWGASREQVVERLGKPDRQNEDMLSYYVSISGYKAYLDIYFDLDGMSQAFYTVGRFYRDWDFNQIKATFAILFGQLEHKYGSYHEIITVARSILDDESHDSFVWHYNNYHVIIVMDDNVGIGYFSDSSWSVFEDAMIENKESIILRLPNIDL